MSDERLAEIRKLRRQRIAKMKDEGPRESCNLGCQRETGVWHVPDEIWATVTGDAIGSYCLRCFDKLAEKQGLLLFWEAREGYYPTDLKYLEARIAELERLVPDAELLQRLLQDAYTTNEMRQTVALAAAIRKYKECDDTNGH